MISVIVPYYCTKKEYFDKCMESILHDKNVDIEVLVIDDGSPVSYHSIVDAYLVDTRVKVFHIKHSGVSIARNMGIEKAKGEWITFVDSDDYLEMNAMSVLHFAVKENEADLIYYNGYGDIDGKIQKNYFFLKEGIDYGINQRNKNKIMESALSLGILPAGYSHSFSLGGVCCKLIRRSMLQDSNIYYKPDIHFAEDALFSMELIQKAQHITYIDQYLYHYNINSESVTNKYRIGLKEDMTAFFQAAWEFIELYCLDNELRDAYYLRAYIELQRCIRKEIWHKESSEPILEKYKITKKFLKSEPYHTALNMKNEYAKGLKYLVITFLLKNSLFKTYINLYEGTKKILVLKK